MPEHIPLDHDPESWRIDPFRITDFARTAGQLEAFACFRRSRQ